MENFSRQEYWSGLPFPSPGDLPNTWIEPGSPALQADSLPTELQGKPLLWRRGGFYFCKALTCALSQVIPELTIIDRKIDKEVNNVAQGHKDKNRRS